MGHSALALVPPFLNSKLVASLAGVGAGVGAGVVAVAVAAEKEGHVEEEGRWKEEGNVVEKGEEQLEWWVVAGLGFRGLGFRV